MSESSKSGNVFPFALAPEMLKKGLSNHENPLDFFIYVSE